MNTQTITTPSGYTLELKDNLSYGGYLEMQEATLAGIKLPVGSNGVDKSALDKALTDIPAISLFAGQRIALRHIVVAAKDPNGQPLDVTTLLDQLPIADGEMLMEEVNKRTERASTDPKAPGK